MSRERLTVLSILLGSSLLIAGWWPFQLFPKNRAHWLEEPPGLGFEPDSFAYDPKFLPQGEGPHDDGATAGFTIALWLEAGEEPNTDVFHVMTIDDGGLPSGLVLCQWKDSLLLRKPAPHSPRGFVEVGARLLQRKQPRLVIVSSGQDGTDFFFDGQRIWHFPDFFMPADSLGGRLILGDAATGKHCWTGKVFGLLILNRVITEPELGLVSDCLTNGTPETYNLQSGTVALYRFDEGAGREVLDWSEFQHHLLIPPRYRVLQRNFLNVPWGAAGPEHLDGRDIVLNVIGFAPFGFLAYFRLRFSRPSRTVQNFILAVVWGGAISLLIEVGQVWLPMRDSNLLDLICNISGTFVGACLAILLLRTCNEPLSDS